MNHLDAIGTEIRRLREEADMPLRKLAAMLDLDQSTLSKIERNERSPNVHIVEQVAKIFNKDKNELLITYYSDVVAEKIQREKNFLEILHVAEAKIEYQRGKKK